MHPDVLCGTINAAFRVHTVELQVETHQRPTPPLEWRQPSHLPSGSVSRAIHRCLAVATSPLFRQLATVFLAYFVAGKLGQAASSIRSGNLGPVWPAYGIALASFLAYGYRVWPAVGASAFLIAYLSPVPAAA